MSLWKITFVHREGGTKTVLASESDVRACADRVCSKFHKAYVFGFLPKPNDGYTICKEDMAWLPEHLQKLARSAE